jgi:hypothetical protein
MLNKARYNVRMAVKNIHGTRIPTGFRDLYSIILFLHNKVINQMGVIKGCHKEGISLSNPLALLHSILHGVDVLGNPLRNLFLVRPSVRLDSVRSLFHRPMNVLAVVNEILNRGPITTVAASLVVLTSRIRHYGGIIIDLVPTAALTVTASSVSSSLSAATKAIVATCSIMIHRHGVCALLLFPTPTLAATSISASSITASTHASPSTARKLHSISFQHCQTRKDK